MNPTMRTFVVGAMLTLATTAAAPIGTAGTPDPYCQQDPDWALCQHYHEPPVAPPSTAGPRG